jgi:hypothetical protein
MLLLAAWAALADTGDSLPAVWKDQHLRLTYLGRTSRYSCDGLREKVRTLLIELGARRDLKVAAVSCAELGEQLQAGNFIPSVDVSFASPALPDPAARPRHAEDAAAVEARFEPFVITNDAFRNMGMGDCELVQDFARQILPKLAVRDVTVDITCVPHEESGSRYLIRGWVLKPLRGPGRS